MIPPANIFSLTDFKQNAKALIAKLRSSKAPLAITINGKASVIIEDASFFEERENRVKQLEKEIQELKYIAFKEALDVGFRQTENGEMSPYSGEEIIANARRKAEELGI